jgi:hypothetical protein
MNPIAPKQIGLQAVDIADVAAGGNIPLPATTFIDQYRALSVKQTTASQTLTLPNPTDVSVLYSVNVTNTGTASFTIYGVDLAPNASTWVTWNGASAWTDDVQKAQPAIPKVEVLTPSAKNTVPDLAAAPKAGYPITYFVNGAYVPSGITNAGAVITYTAATVTYNLETFDTLTAYYYV